MAAVRGVRCVDVWVGNIQHTSDFYGGIWGLKEVARSKDARFYRGTSHYHHILGLFDRGRPALLRIIFDAANRADVDALHRQVATAKIGAVEKPHALTRPGGGYGFGFKDAEGRNLAVVCDVADHKDATVEPDRPIKITHVNLNSAKADTAYRFYIDALGFKLSDKSDMFYFMRCNSDHHSILIAKMSAPTLNHISFEMMDINSVMRGAGRLNDHGYPIEWGPGRHGAGSNMFCYFAGPWELRIDDTDVGRSTNSSAPSMGPTTGNGRRTAPTAGA